MLLLVQLIELWVRSDEMVRIDEEDGLVKFAIALSRKREKPRIQAHVPGDPVVEWMARQPTP